MSLQELGQFFRLGSLLARKLLELAGIDYVADLHRQAVDWNAANASAM